MDPRPEDEIEARRAGSRLHYGLGFTAAPSALDYLGFD
nr:J327 [uncultured bacterium]